MIVFLAIALMAQFVGFAILLAGIVKELGRIADALEKHNDGRDE